MSLVAPLVDIGGFDVKARCFHQFSIGICVEMAPVHLDTVPIRFCTLPPLDAHGDEQSPVGAHEGGKAPKELGVAVARSVEHGIEGNEAVHTELAWFQLEHVANLKASLRHLGPGKLDLPGRYVDPDYVITVVDQVAGHRYPGATADIEHTRGCWKQLCEALEVGRVFEKVSGRGITVGRLLVP